MMRRLWMGCLRGRLGKGRGLELGLGWKVWGWMVGEVRCLLSSQFVIIY